jgi:hypothetical protein
MHANRASEPPSPAARRIVDRAANREWARSARVASEEPWQLLSVDHPVAIDVVALDNLLRAVVAIDRQIAELAVLESRTRGQLTPHGSSIAIGVGQSKHLADQLVHRIDVRLAIDRQVKFNQ